MDLQHGVAGVMSHGHIPKGKHELLCVPLAWHHAEHPVHAVSSAVRARGCASCLSSSLARLWGAED